MNPRGADLYRDPVQETLAAIDRLAEFGPDWDSYEADPVPLAARERAKRCVLQVSSALGLSYATPIVGPTTAGVGLVWRDPRQGEVQVLLSPSDARFVVTKGDRSLAATGSISDFEIFAREVLTRHLTL